MDSPDAGEQGRSLRDMYYSAEEGGWHEHKEWGKHVRDVYMVKIKCMVHGVCLYVVVTAVYEMNGCGELGSYHGWIFYILDKVGIM